MVNNNYPQITSVTSEALQAQIRALLPSQEGFGTDLMAQNVIVPIIDLTSAAEGSSVSENLQNALAFGSQTAFSSLNSTVVLANTVGFWRIYANCAVRGNGASNTSGSLSMSDGFSTKTIWKCTVDAGTALDTANNNIDLIVWLATGESISCTTDGFTNFTGSIRQIADSNGTLINPSGFNPQ